MICNDFCRSLEVCNVVPNVSLVTSVSE